MIPTAFCGRLLDCSQQLAQFILLIKPIVVDRMPVRRDLAVTLPITQGVWRNTKKGGCFLDREIISDVHDAYLPRCWGECRQRKPYQAIIVCVNRNAKKYGKLWVVTEAWRLCSTIIAGETIGNQTSGSKRQLHTTINWSPLSRRASYYIMLRKLGGREHE